LEALGRVWEVEYDWLLSRFDSKESMEASGIPSTRWFDATMLPKDQVRQKDNLKAMFIMGHGGNTVTRMPDSAKGIEALELLVVADPVPTTWAVLSERKDGTYLLPICTSYEADGSRTASNRSLQWGEQIVKPIFESKNDLEVMFLLAKKLGFEDRMFKNIKVENSLPVAEDLLREINRGGWSTGYCGQSPERLKVHMANQKDFDLVTLRAKDGSRQGRLLRPAVAVLGHAGAQTPGHAYALQHQPACDGRRRHLPGTFWRRAGSHAARWQQGEAQPAGRRLLFARLRDQGRLSRVHHGGAQEARLGHRPHAGGTRRDRKVGGANIDAVSWSTDLSGGIQRVAMKHGCIHYGNGKARANAWTLPDPVPVHREPIYTPRPELVAKYPTLPNAVQFRVPNIGFDVQKAAVEKGVAKLFPLILTSGRLVEYEGGGEETRSTSGSPSCSRMPSSRSIRRMRPRAASRMAAGFWVSGAEMAAGKACRMKALVNERVGKGVTWMPFHFAGFFQGVDQRSRYPPAPTRSCSARA